MSASHRVVAHGQLVISMAGAYNLQLTSGVELAIWSFDH